MWDQLTPQQQQYLMQMLMSQGGMGQPVTSMPGGPLQPAMTLGARPNMRGQMNPAQMPGMPQAGMQLANPLMAGGNSAVNPQQQAQMMQYLQALQSPQSWGASANGNPAIWQMLMGRSPYYGTGGAVP